MSCLYTRKEAKIDRLRNYRHSFFRKALLEAARTLTDCYSVVLLDAITAGANRGILLWEGVCRPASGCRRYSYVLMSLT